MKRRMVIGGNWKMQRPLVEESIIVVKKIAKRINKLTKIDIFIAPSTNVLFSTGKEIRGTGLELAGQNMSSHEIGAFTGETSVNSLVEAGCKYVLLGHSERRHIFHETNESINAKIKLALQKGLRVVLCVGETAKERKKGLILEVNQDQLSKSLKNIDSNQLENIIIAYEPVWAINNKFLNPAGDIIAATSFQANEAHQIVRDWFSDNYDKKIAQDIQILYGGSLKPENCQELLSLEHVDGGLIGGASLDPQSLYDIAKTANGMS